MKTNLRHVHNLFRRISRHVRALAKGCAYALAFAHLMVVAFTVLHGFDRQLHKSWMIRPLSCYNSLTYAVWQYGFFAPDVGCSTEVEINVHSDSGQVTRYSTLRGFRFFTSNIESANRFYGFKVKTTGVKSFHDLSARSVAVRMLNIHEDASRIEYVMRTIRYPAIDEYVNGAPVRKIEFYRTTIALRPQ